jgi:hypothetical protein
MDEDDYSSLADYMHRRFDRIADQAEAMKEPEKPKPKPVPEVIDDAPRGRSPDTDFESDGRNFPGWYR